MQKMRIDEVCKATRGIPCGLDKSLIIEGVSTDSRSDVTGKLFIPIVGDTFDGHDYIEKAIENGAVCALTEQKQKDGLIKVDSTRQALIDLAVNDRSHFTGPVVAITGSAGKTTTKEIIASVLSQKYKTLKTVGNFNNDIGLPLTLLGRKKEHEAMVLEMGMNHLGEIRVLSKIGRPDICLITNIGDAHIENLGSREGILKAKSEIFEGMKQGGTVILNGDDPLLAALPKVPHAKKTIYCSMNDVCNIKHMGLPGTTCEIYGTPVKVPLPGAHMIMNAIMAFAVGRELGVTPQQIAEGIKAFKPPGHRMAITEANGMTVVNDAYNASPSSMKAAIDIMCEIEGRKVCILGDMLELGDFAQALHEEVGDYAAAKKMDLLIAIGPLSKHMRRAVYFETKEAFLAKWHQYLKQGDTVLIKASRGMALESIAEEISK